MLDFHVKERKCLIVYINPLKEKFIKKMTKYGNISYISSNMNYIIMYVDYDYLSDIQNQINKFNFVKEVINSKMTSLNNYFVQNNMIRGIEN